MGKTLNHFEYQMLKIFALFSWEKKSFSEERKCHAHKKLVKEVGHVIYLMLTPQGCDLAIRWCSGVLSLKAVKLHPALSDCRVKSHTC